MNLTVDEINQERIVFNINDFTDIAAATANEIVAAYNRQAKYSYAIPYYDSNTKQTYIRIFTNTIGAQGSISVSGGLANIGLEFNGFLHNLGTGSNTQWIVTKVGNTVTFTYNAGTVPGIEALLPGDIFLCDLAGNKGSFIINNVDIRLKSFQFENLLATTGTFSQTTSKQIKWMRPVKVTSFALRRRALVWETTPGAVSIEMPATPSIVNRDIKGGMHINGKIGVVTAVNSSSSLTLRDTTDLPTEGYFLIEPITAVTSKLKGDLSETVVTTTSNGRVVSDFIRYHYTNISGNTLTGITPDLPSITSLNEVTISSLSRTSNLLTAIVSNNFTAGDLIFIKGSSGVPVVGFTGSIVLGSTTITTGSPITQISPGQIILGTGIPVDTTVVSVINPTTVIMSKAATATAPSATIFFNENTNGPFQVVSATPTQFTVNQIGTDGAVSTAGVVSKEEPMLATDNFKVIITTSISSDITKIKGPYIWQLNTPFTLSADTSTTVSNIVAGKNYKLLTLNTNNIPDGPGYIVLDYGKNNQEGPIRYLYKAAENILAIETSYTFQQFHDANASVVAVRKLGPHTPTGSGNEYPPYLTNPPDARKLLQELINSVTSAGIFIDYVIRYPVQLYGTINVYD